MALDADRTLALSYIPAARRVAVQALWQLDVALGAVLAGGREPMISRIKLAWWREALERLDTAPPPAEPVLEQLAEHVIPLGVSGTELAEMEEGWSLLLTPGTLSEDELTGYALKRGGMLFRFSARLLGDESSPAVERGGEAWALADLARRGSKSEAEAALAGAAERSVSFGAWPSRLRPIGMLAMLAQRDALRGVEALEPHGAPRRMLRMLRHRLTGR